MEPAMSIRTRLNIIGMAVFGPAETGPYGESAGPPPPRLRNAKGRLLSNKKIAELVRLNAVASATATASLDSVRQTFSDVLSPSVIPH